MLPGFNHNIRYQNRVFHIQTEDSGLNQPYLVTQVFIGGHLVAIEKSSYVDLLAGKVEQEDRNEQIRNRMQDQHKRLLKNLIKHAYDDKISLYLGSPSSRVEPPRAPPRQPSIEVESPARPAPSGDLAVIEAATLPVADEIPDQAHSPVSGVMIALDADDAIKDDDLFKVFDEELQKQVPWSPSNTQGSLPPLDPAYFDPNDLVDTIPPESPARTRAAAAKAANEPPPRRPPPPPAATVDLPKVTYPDRTQPDRTLRPANSSTVPRDRRPRPPMESPTEIGRKAPIVADTLVDFGLPAALKEQLGQAKAALEQARRKAQDVGLSGSARKSDPRVNRFRMPRSPSPSPTSKREHERETQIDLALRKRASSTRNSKLPAGTESTAETLLDVNAGEVQEFIAKKKRERSDAAAASKPPAPAKQNGESWGDAVETAPGLTPPEDTDSKRPNILVVERSLDEVILSYLADED